MADAGEVTLNDRENSPRLMIIGEIVEGEEILIIEGE